MTISTNRKSRLKITADIDYNVTVTGLNVGGSLVFAQSTTLLTVTTNGVYLFTSDDSTKTISITSAGLSGSVAVDLAALDNSSADGAATSSAQTTGNNSLNNIDADIGGLADAEATGNGSVIGILKRIRTLVGNIPIIGPALSAASQSVVQATDAIFSVNQPAVSASGTITALNSNLATGAATANSSVALQLNGATGYSVDIRGTFTQTLLVQGSVTGNDWVTLSVIPVGAGLNIAQVASVTAQGAWWGNANGLQQIRVTCSALTSGTATVNLRAMQSTGVVYNMPTGVTTQPVTVGSFSPGANLIADIGHQARATTGGITTAANRLISAAASTNGTVVKGSAGRLYKVIGQNTSATTKYLKFSNSATITVGTTAVVFTLVLPPVTFNNGYFEFNLADYGVFFSTGISYGITGAPADNDTTALVAGDIAHLNCFFL